MGGEVVGEGGVYTACIWPVSLVLEYEIAAQG